MFHRLTTPTTTSGTRTTVLTNWPKDGGTRCRNTLQLTIFTHTCSKRWALEKWKQLSSKLSPRFRTLLEKFVRLNASRASLRTVRATFMTSGQLKENQPFLTSKGWTLKPFRVSYWRLTRTRGRLCTMFLPQDLTIELPKSYSSSNSPARSTNLKTNAIDGAFVD